MKASEFMGASEKEAEKHADTPKFTPQNSVTCKVRCWNCCFQHGGTANLTWLNRWLLGPKMIRLPDGNVMCDMLASNSKGQTMCLIYRFRPKLCRDSFCASEWVRRETNGLNFTFFEWKDNIHSH